MTDLCIVNSQIAIIKTMPNKMLANSQFDGIKEQ